MMVAVRNTCVNRIFLKDNSFVIIMLNSSSSRVMIGVSWQYDWMYSGTKSEYSTTEVVPSLLWVVIFIFRWLFVILWYKNTEFILDYQRWVYSLVILSKQFPKKAIRFSFYTLKSLIVDTFLVCLKKNVFLCGITITLWIRTCLD